MSAAPPSGFRCTPGGEALAARLHALWPAQAVDHALLLLDADARFVAMNEGAATIFEAEDGALLGEPFATIFTERDRVHGLDAQELAVAQRLGASEDDRWHRRCDGTEFWSHGALRTVRDGGGAVLGYVKLIRDRTDLRAQMDATAHRFAVAEAALALRTRELATIGHELRGPLGAIANAVHAMGLPNAAPERTARLHEIVERQMEIASRLLREALPGEGDAEPGAPELREVALQDVLESAAGAVRALPISADRAIELIVPAVPLVLTTDPVLAERIVRNLLENACKYTEPGGHAWLTATLEGDSAVIRVRDDGIGISNDLLPRIFDWFVRGDEAASAGIEGFGLGLGIVRDLVRRLHGTVEVVSTGVHGGSEFTVNLPIAPPSSERALARR